MSSVGYYLLACQSWNIFQPTEYFMYMGRTRDKTKAARWFSYEDAQEFADAIPGNWQPVLVLFDGESIAGTNSLENRYSK